MEESADFFEKVCRVCTLEKKSLISIQTPTETIKYDIPSKLMACADINVQYDDQLPSKICFNCLASLNAAFDFRALCKKSDGFFRKILRKTTKDTDNVKNLWIKEENFEDEATMDFLETTLDEIEPTPNQTRKSERLLRRENLSIENNNFNIQESQLSHLMAMREKRSYTRRRPLRIHKCETCDKTYKSRTEWRRHYLRSHGIKMEKLDKKTECSVCHHTFQSWKILRDHQRESGHYAKETCEHCQKTFSRSYMSEHLRTHTGEQPLLCTTCGKHFWVQSIFKKHSERCANMEKKFKCSYCDRRFYGTFPLKVHERIHTKEKPYVCETCGKAFRLKSKLTIHQNTHTDVRPYPCLTCGRKFRQRTHLKEHIRIHTGVKPYICDICGAGFTQGHSLKTHQIRHTPLAQDGTN